MFPNPLHPAIVHFPIVLAFLLPVAALLALLQIRRGVDGRRAWIWVVLLAAGLFGSSLVAVETGEDQEEIVEEVVSESAIHEHEEAAERLRLMSGIAFLLCGAGLVAGRAGTVGRWAGTAAALVTVLAAINTGGTGGALVYEHGAAAAYTGAGAAARSGRTADREAEDDRDDDHQD